MPEGVDAQPSIHPPEPLKPVVDSATPDAGQWWAVLLEEKHLPLYQQLLSSANAPIHPPPENLSLQSFSGWMDSVLSDMARGRQKRKENRETLELAEQINPGNAAALLYAYTEARCAYYEAEVAGDTNRIFFTFGEVVGLESALAACHLEHDRKTIDKLMNRIPTIDKTIFKRGHDRLAQVYRTGK